MWHKILLLIAIIINVLLVGRLFLSEQGLEGYAELKKETAVLQEKLNSLQHKNVALSREIELLVSDDKYLEKIIRDRLNFVQKNEILYLFEDNELQDISGEKPNDRKN